MDATPATPRPTPRVANAILVAGFLAAITAPGLVQFLGVDLGSLAENRHRAMRPALAFDRATLAEFPAKFDAYYNDSFGLRDQLIRWGKFAKVAALGSSPSPNVIIGRRGWLYYAGESSVEDMRRSRPFTIPEMEGWRRTYEARRNWLAQRNIRYLMVIPPNKHTVYPEFLPARYAPTQAQSRYEQLRAYLRDNTDLPLLDLRDPLLAAKGRGRLYYPHDTHWNQRGAMVAYQAITSELNRYYGNIRPQPAAAFWQARADHTYPDMAMQMGLGDILPDRAEPVFAPIAGHKAKPVPIDPGSVPGPETGPQWTGSAWEQPDPTLPRVVIFGDSFTVSLMPYLAEHFSRAFFLMSTTMSFDSAAVEREQPQVVIDEILERKFAFPAPSAGIREPVIARK